MSGLTSESLLLVLEIIKVINFEYDANNHYILELYCVCSVNEKCKLEQTYDSIFHYHRIGKDSKEW